MFLPSILSKTVIFLILLFSLSGEVIAQITGKVVRIADGDSFTILTGDKKQVKIRLYGIDCPEKKQPYGNKAKQYTSALVFGNMVTVQEKDIDRYGRTIGIVQLPSGRILNEELLKNGFAWHYKKYDNNAAWAKMEMEARTAKRGLWSDKNAVAPWDWRRK